MGSSGRPSFPINILADMAGGGLTCVMGILLALLERQRSGRGQVVDNDMVVFSIEFPSVQVVNAHYLSKGFWDSLCLFVVFGA